MKTFKNETKQKLSKFLLESYNGGLPYSVFCKLLRKKDIKVNGKRVNNDILLEIGDVVEIYFDGTQKPLTVVYESSDILVLDKPRGITVEDFFSQVKREYETAVLCHRLDRNTKGLLVFALNKTAENEMLKAFKLRTVKKYYLCKTYGKFEKESGVYTAFLVKDEKESLVKIYKEKVKNSVEIKTGFKVLKTFEDYQMVEVELFTGKTHQIRAHSAFLGHFVIGDGKYGRNEINEKFNQKYQNLTAYKLRFNFDKESPLNYLNEKEIVLENNDF